MKTLRHRSGTRSWTKALRLGIGLVGVLTLFGCSATPQSIVPPHLANDVNQTLTFPEIKQAPDTHKGTTVVLGGEVLAAKRLKDRTKLTILQLPLDSDQEPATERTSSQGRFVAYRTEFLDPATLPAGTRVTIVGTVDGQTTEALDETEYTYPIVQIQHLRVWMDTNRILYPPLGFYRPLYWGGPFWGRFGGYYGFGPYPYWYW